MTLGCHVKNLFVNEVVNSVKNGSVNSLNIISGLPLETRQKGSVLCKFQITILKSNFRIVRGTCQSYIKLSFTFLIEWIKREFDGSLEVAQRIPKPTWYQYARRFITELPTQKRFEASGEINRPTRSTGPNVALVN